MAIMKINKALLVVIKIVFMLYTLCFTSCEFMKDVFYCKECTNGTDTVFECSQHSIDDLESQGWTCN